jgi:hypothetical protein
VLIRAEDLFPNADSALVATPPDQQDGSAGWIDLSLGVARKDRVRVFGFLEGDWTYRAPTVVLRQTV